jgi:hypothetical protein
MTAAGPGQGRECPASPRQERAEAALAANYGLGRKIYEGVGGTLGVATVYLEITPAGLLR